MHSPVASDTVSGAIFAALQDQPYTHPRVINEATGSPPSQRGPCTPCWTSNSGATFGASSPVPAAHFHQPQRCQTPPPIRVIPETPAKTRRPVSQQSTPRPQQSAMQLTQPRRIGGSSKEDEIYNVGGGLLSSLDVTSGGPTQRRVTPNRNGFSTLRHVSATYNMSSHQPIASPGNHGDVETTQQSGGHGSGGAMFSTKPFRPEAVVVYFEQTVPVTVMTPRAMPDCRRATTAELPGKLCFSSLSPGAQGQRHHHCRTQSTASTDFTPRFNAVAAGALDATPRQMKFAGPEADDLDDDSFAPTSDLFGFANLPTVAAGGSGGFLPFGGRRLTLRPNNETDTISNDPREASLQSILSDSNPTLGLRSKNTHRFSTHHPSPPPPPVSESRSLFSPKDDDITSDSFQQEEEEYEEEVEEAGGAADPGCRSLFAHHSPAVKSHHRPRGSFQESRGNDEDEIGDRFNQTRFEFLHYIPWLKTCDYIPLHLDVNGTVWLAINTIDGLPYAVKEVPRSKFRSLAMELFCLTLGNGAVTQMQLRAADYIQRYFTVFGQDTGHPQHPLEEQEPNPNNTSVESMLSATSDNEMPAAVERHDVFLLQLEYFPLGNITELWLQAAFDGDVNPAAPQSPSMLHFTMPSEDDVLCCTRQVLCALSALHDNGVVHGNPLPWNIFAAGQNHFKLGNFGSAKVADANRLHRSPGHQSGDAEGATSPTLSDEEEMLQMFSSCPLMFLPLQREGDAKVPLWLPCEVDTYILFSSIAELLIRCHKKQTRSFLPQGSFGSSFLSFAALDNLQLLDPNILSNYYSPQLLHMLQAVIVERRRIPTEDLLVALRTPSRRVFLMQNTFETQISSLLERIEIAKRGKEKRHLVKLHAQQQRLQPSKKRSHSVPSSPCNNSRSSRAVNEAHSGRLNSSDDSCVSSDAASPMREPTMNKRRVDVASTDSCPTSPKLATAGSPKIMARRIFTVPPPLDVKSINITNHAALAAVFGLASTNESPSLERSMCLLHTPLLASSHSSRNVFAASTTFAVPSTHRALFDEQRFGSLSSPLLPSPVQHPSLSAPRDYFSPAAAAMATQPPSPATAHRAPLGEAAGATPYRPFALPPQFLASPLQASTAFLSSSSASFCNPNNTTTSSSLLSSQERNMQQNTTMEWNSTPINVAHDRTSRFGTDDYPEALVQVGECQLSYTEESGNAGRHDSLARECNELSITEEVKKRLEVATQSVVGMAQKKGRIPQDDEDDDGNANNAAAVGLLKSTVLLVQKMLQDRYGDELQAEHRPLTSYA